MSRQVQPGAVDPLMQALQSTPAGTLPSMPGTVKNEDTLQWFYKAVLNTFACMDGGESPLYLRREGQNLYIRHKGQWRAYGRRDSLEFWRDAMASYKALAESNWSVKRLQAAWDYFQAYAPEAEFDNRRYFETANAVLDTITGELDYSEERFLNKPTTRSSTLPYDPAYEPSVAWQKWYGTLDEHQKLVRDWSVGSAVAGEHGLLFTYGQSRTGKSTLAEGLSATLGDGARVFSLSSDFGRFATKFMENTTYLYDPDSKGSKNHNNANYETLHLMASGDPIKVEIKGGDMYQTTNYGFVEIVSNAPVGMSFEQSLVDRVRFCLYTYIEPRADGGTLKRQILADKQAWLNYAIRCAIRLAKGEITRPPIDEYQAYGWVQWLSATSSYARLCFQEMRVVGYSEYQQTVVSKYLLSKETVEDTQAGMREISRQLGQELTTYDWETYGETLAELYYNGGGNGNEATELF